MDAAAQTHRYYTQKMSLEVLFSTNQALSLLCYQQLKASYTHSLSTVSSSLSKNRRQTGGCSSQQRHLLTYVNLRSFNNHLPRKTRLTDLFRLQQSILFLSRKSQTIFFEMCFDHFEEVSVLWPIGCLPTSRSYLG